MKKKYSIRVRTKEGEGIKTIKRVLTGKSIGNFNPIFCRYQGKEHLVHSIDGDLSDPFRRDKRYLESLYINI